jgi:hypothetical protein
MNSEYSRYTPKPPNWVEIWTLIVLVCAFGAALYAGHEARRLADSTDVSIAKADESATKQREISVDAEQRQLRAYMQASPGNVFNLKSGARLEARIVIDNSGQTPGDSVKRWAAMKISRPLTADEITALGSGDREEGTMVSMPHASHVIIRGLDAPTAQQSDAIIRGDQRLYLFGRIEYADIFDKSDQHRTSEFCFVYYGEVQDWPENGGPGYNSTQARYCETHNNAN